MRPARERAADRQKAVGEVDEAARVREREGKHHTPSPAESHERWSRRVPVRHREQVPRRGRELEKARRCEAGAVDQHERELIERREKDEREDAVRVLPLSRPLGKEARHEDEQRHVEEVDDVEEAAYGRVVVVDGVRDVPHHHEDDEQALDVVEERDASRARSCSLRHRAPRAQPSKASAF